MAKKNTKEDVKDKEIESVMAPIVTPAAEAITIPVGARDNAF